jgi:hypothetical protein
LIKKVVTMFVVRVVALTSTVIAGDVNIPDLAYTKYAVFAVSWLTAKPNQPVPEGWVVYELVVNATGLPLGATKKNFTSAVCGGAPYGRRATVIDVELPPLISVGAFGRGT